MQQLKKVIAPILMLILISVSPLWSGTTGKIAGSITDKDNGEPVIGATIIISGTSLGAATDLDGHFTILFVPPGSCNLQISSVGYRKVLVKDIRVHIDQTARVDVALEPQAIEVNALVVVGERLTIKKDVATSVASVNDKEVAALPINNAVSAIGLQAGVRGGWDANPNGAAQPTFVNNYNRGKVSVQGGLSIRGGAGDEILFMMDGVTLRDPRNNEPTTGIPLSSIKEISVERGGFQAEYGQVRSGVVNVVTREGGKRGFSGSVQLRMSPPQAKYYKGPGIMDIDDPNSWILRPFFDPNVCWTGTAHPIDSTKWDQYTISKYPAFDGWNKISQRLMSDNDPSNDLSPEGAQRVFEYEIRKKQQNNQPDYDIDAGLGGPIPLIGQYLGDLRFFTSYRGTRSMLVFPLSRPDYRDYNWTAQATSDITSSMKLKLSVLFGHEYTMEHNWDANGVYFYPQYPTDIANVIGAVAGTADLNRVFSDFDFSIADIGQRSLSAKLTHVINPSTFYEVSIEHFQRKYDVGQIANRNTSILTQVIPGFFEDSNPFGYDSQTDPHGVIITGDMHAAKAHDHTVTQSATVKADFTSQVNFQNLIKGGIQFNYDDLNFDYGTTEITQYVNRVQMHVFPIMAGAYIQDKLETEGLTVNLGLRADYSDARVNWWDINQFDPSFFQNNAGAGQTYQMSKSKPQFEISPRLGIAHPVTENSKLFFNYGHFMQEPQYESLFRIQRNDQKVMTSFGNPNLVMQKTVSYELGYDHILFDEYLFQIAAFYNDVTDQQDFTLISAPKTNVSYLLSTSNNYEDDRGFEITLRRTTGRWWSGFANYTYMVNSSGHFGSGELFNNSYDQTNWDQTTGNLYAIRPIPQPYARLNLSFYSPDDFGALLGSWRANVVLDWQAGFWTTWNPKNIPAVQYNVSSVDYFNTTLRVEKSIPIGKMRINFFMDVNNVFNTLRLYNTGDQGYMTSLHLPKSNAYDNIPGNDEVGNYRKLGVDWQPENPQNTVVGTTPPNDYRAWFYEGTTGKYWKVVKDPSSPNGNKWVQVDQASVDRVNKDKAYINMPNDVTFWFLNPRQIFFGIRLSIDFNEL